VLPETVLQDRVDCSYILICQNYPLGSANRAVFGAAVVELDSLAVASCAVEATAFGKAHTLISNAGRGNEAGKHER
jgi:hypothetical protein